MYQWNNENRLKDLKVSEKDNILVYETKTEKAEVCISNGDISKVVCHYKGVSIGIDKKDSHYLSVGDGNTRRDVYHYIKPGGPLPFLRLGITKHCDLGTWSSLPHPFELKPEPGFEEIFFYILEGGQEKAIQVGRGMWCDGSKVDAVWRVQNNSWSTIPMGCHPVVAEPDVHVSYIWAYLAKKKEWEKI